MLNLFEQTPINHRRYGVAFFVGIIAGVISSFVKWGAEHPLPPRSPLDFFQSACLIDITGLSQEQILEVCSRAVLNPPHLFLRNYLGIDPLENVFTFADYGFNWIGVTHILFSIFFAVGYCVVAEVFPKIKIWQGVGAGIMVDIIAHYFVLPAIGLTPAVAQWPWYEHVSELVGHILWFWTIEIIRRDLRNRITHQPDPEVI